MTTVVEIHETSRPRAGRRFAPTHELALAEPALSACRTLPNSHRGLLIVKELVGPLGIPDLTALIGPPELLANRLDLEVPPLLNEVDSAIVSATHPQAARSSVAIAHKLQWPERIVNARIPALLRSGALSRTVHSKFTRPAALAPLGRVYAVEAKVCDRTAALRQARSYSVWADGYVLVMGKLAERPLELLNNHVKEDNGGLVVDGRWIRRPVVQRLARSRRLWTAEHIVAAMRK